MEITDNQRQALQLLADTTDGCTLPALVRCGCTLEELHRLVREGLASADQMNVLGKPRGRPALVRLRISAAGRRMLARRDRTNQGLISVRLVLLVLFALGLLAGVCVGAFMISHA